MANTTGSGGGSASADPILAALDASEQFLASVDALIKSQLEGTFLDAVPGVDYIAHNLQSQIENAEKVIAQAESAIRTQIEPLLQAAGPNAIGTLIGVAEAFQQDISNLVGNIATTEDVITSAITVLKGHAPELASWIFNHVTSGFGSVALGVLKEMEQQDGDGINATLDALLAIPDAPEWFTKLTLGFRNRGAEWQALALPAILGAILFSAISAMTEPFATAVRQGAYDQMPTKEADTPLLVESMMRGLVSPERYAHGMRQQGFAPDIATLAIEARRELLDIDVITRALIRGEVKDTRWNEELSSRGIEGDRQEIILRAALTPLGDEDIRTAFLRGMLKPADHDAAMARLGYEDGIAELRRQLYYFIPPVADLVHMGVRNVFVPEIVKRFNLDGDYPAEFGKAAQQQGVSEEWSHKYWQSHWIMPGRDAFFEMFQRTHDTPLDPNADTITLSDGSKVYNIMGKETLNLALRDIDTPPFYRQLLTQIAYRPFTRIDIRRMASIGALDHAGVERAYLDLGYAQDRARKLADFTDQLNAKGKKDEAALLVDGIRKQVLRLFEQGKLSGDQVSSTLSDLGFTSAESRVFMEETNLVQSAAKAQALEAAIGRLYVAGFITDREAIKRMMAAGVPVDAQSLLFERWDMEIEYRGGTQHMHQHRELTKSEVLTALVDGLITEETAVTMLQHLGYDESGTNAEIALALYRSEKAAKTAKVDAIKASFTNGTITDLDASNRLDALQVPADQRDAYLETWSLQRETRTERIPLATLRDLVKGGYIDDAALMVHLKRHRFTDSDAQLLVQYWTNQPAPKGLISVSGT